VTVEGTGELVLSERSTGLGWQPDGVFGARFVAAPVIAGRSVLAVSLDLRLGTLGAKGSVGTDAVNVRSTDVKSDLLAHLRWPIPVAQLRIVPAALIGLDTTIAAQTITAPGGAVRRVEFVFGIGYGVRAALEGERFSVAVSVLLVSTDTRAPAVFMGLSAGYVVRL
jgi:hypothetical protein